MSAPLGLADHPEIIDLGDSFALACYRAIDYCAFHRTDGRIPRSVASRMFGAQVDDAIAIGFLEVDGNSLRVAQFLDVNLRADQRENARHASSAGSSTASPTASGTGCKEKEKKKDKKKENTEPPSGAAPASPGPVATATGPRRGTLERHPRDGAPEESATHPNRRAVIDALERVYLEATGQSIDWKDRKNRGIANDLAKRFDVDEIEARARRFWIDRLPDFVWNGKVTVCCLADFRAHFERLAVAKPRQSHIPEDFRPARIEDLEAMGFMRRSAEA